MKSLKIFIFLAFTLSSFNVFAQKNNSKVGLRDSTDHAIDMSDFLLNKNGLLVVPSVITEPAVGYGALAAVIYFHSSYADKKAPPSMSGILGGGTENGTWFGGAFHIGYWKQDHIRYLGAIARMNVNIGFYGSGNIGETEKEPVNMNMDAWLVLQQLRFRISETNFFAGGRYIYYNTDNTFNLTIDVPEFEGTTFISTLSEASVLFNYDSRNNIFTPTKGLLLELSGTYSVTWMGGEDLYGRINARIIGYVPASEKMVLGVRHESAYALGNVPFYARPVVILRGAPLMKYQDKNTSVIEAEINWNVYKRWNLIGFMGMGNAFSSFEDFNKGKTVASIGTGFRYLLARKFGMQMGMDFAQSTDDFAFYFVFGTSWLR